MDSHWAVSTDYNVTSTATTDIMWI
jgi:hypothetical protein